MSKSKQTIFCVDDNPSVLRLLTALFEADGYQVVTANHPRKALELAERTPFDLAILDYQMTGMNGASLAKEMRRKRPTVPLLLFSGSPALPAEALLEVDDYVTKGEGPELLLQKTRELLQLAASGVSGLIPKGSLANDKRVTAGQGFPGRMR